MGATTWIPSCSCISYVNDCHPPFLVQPSFCSSGFLFSPSLFSSSSLFFHGLGFARCFQYRFRAHNPRFFGLGGISDRKIEVVSWSSFYTFSISSTVSGFFFVFLLYTTFLRCDTPVFLVPRHLLSVSVFLFFSRSLSLSFFSASDKYSNLRDSVSFARLSVSSSHGPYISHSVVSNEHS